MEDIVAARAMRKIYANALAVLFIGTAGCQSTITENWPSEAVTFWSSVILWILVVVSIILVGVIAFQVFRKPPTGETNAERQARIQSVFDLLKFLLGTVAVGVLTLAVEQGIKQREEIVKERDQTNKETGRGIGQAIITVSRG